MMIVNITGKRSNLLLHDIDDIFINTYIHVYDEYDAWLRSRIEQVERERERELSP